MPAEDAAPKLSRPHAHEQKENTARRRYPEPTRAERIRKALSRDDLPVT